MRNPPIPVNVALSHVRGLVAAFFLNEGGGPRAHNAIGAPHGDLDTSVSWVDDGCSFDGSGDANIMIPHNYGVGNPGTLIAGVILPTTSEHGAVIKVGDRGDGYGVGVGSGNFNSDGNDVVALYNNVRWIDSGEAIGTGKHQIGIAVNAGGDTPRLFLDGAQLGVYSGGVNNAPTNELYIGSDDYSGRFFTATIVYALYYKRELATEDVGWLYNNLHNIKRCPIFLGAITDPPYKTVHLTWQDNSTGETGFSIERSSTSETEGFSEVDAVAENATEYEDEVLPGTYWYRVRAHDDAGGYSGYSNVAEVTVEA